MAGDGAKSRGVLYLPAGPRPKAVSVFTHPSADLLQYWTTLDWLARGYAAFTYTTRYVNNFTDCSHELLILDVGGVIALPAGPGLRADHPVRQVGRWVDVRLLPGAGLGARGEAGPVLGLGWRPDLNSYELPPADGLISWPLHPGGAFLEGIARSVGGGRSRSRRRRLAARHVRRPQRLAAATESSTYKRDWLATHVPPSPPAWRSSTPSPSTGSRRPGYRPICWLPRRPGG